MKIGWANLLELGTVTVTSDAPLYPACRLHDRRFGRNWIATSTATQIIRVDQGASGTQAVDALVVPSGHNLSGCSMQWQYSDNGSSWTGAVTGWTQSGSGMIVKQSAAPSTHRYWRLEISGATSAPGCAEVYMTLLCAFDNPIYGTTRATDRVVTRQLSYTGIPHLIKQGTSKRLYRGTVIVSGTINLSSWEAFLSAWDGCKPFFIEDHDGNQYFAEFVSEPELTYNLPGSNHYRIELREVS